MTAKEIAKQSGVPLWKVYYVANKLGREPSVEEVATWKQKRGRPATKWVKQDYSNAFYNMFADSNALLENLKLKKEN